MTYIIIYYIIGILISLYHIWYYRFSKKTSGTPKNTDSIGGLVGPWIWPLQIIKHLIDRNIK